MKMVTDNQASKMKLQLSVSAGLMTNITQMGGRPPDNQYPHK